MLADAVKKIVYSAASNALAAIDSLPLHNEARDPLLDAFLESIKSIQSHLTFYFVHLLHLTTLCNTLIEYHMFTSDNHRQLP